MPRKALREPGLARAPGLPGVRDPGGRRGSARSGAGGRAPGAGGPPARPHRDPGGEPPDGAQPEGEPARHARRPRPARAPAHLRLERARRPRVPAETAAELADPEVGLVTNLLVGEDAPGLGATLENLQ